MVSVGSTGTSIVYHSAINPGGPLLHSFQNPLVDTCGHQPHPKTRQENNGQGKLFLEAKESHQEEKNAGQNSPKGAFGELLHDLGIPVILQIHPHEDKGAGERHNTDQTGR